MGGFEFIHGYTLSTLYAGVCASDPACNPLSLPGGLLLTVPTHPPHVPFISLPKDVL